MTSVDQVAKSEVPGPFDLLVFDWDGTLRDSVASIVGCGLAALAKRVVSVEVFEDLHEGASLKLRDKEIDNVELFVGDVMAGWQPEQAHDVVVVTGSVPSVPESLGGWVNPGGRMFVITGQAPAMEARLLTRLNATDWREESLFETDLQALVHSEESPRFEFTQTDYYESTMGPGLRKVFFTFAEPFDAADMADVKLRTNAWRAAKVPC